MGARCMVISVKSLVLIWGREFEVDIKGPWWVAVYMYKE
jgi:hypothetical protein